MKALLVTLIVGLPIPLSGYLIANSLFSRIESQVLLKPGVTIEMFCEFVDFINLTTITEMCRQSGVFFTILLRDVSFGLGLAIVVICIIIGVKLRLSGSDQTQVANKLFSLTPLISLISFLIIFSQAALAHSFVLQKLQQTPISPSGYIAADEDSYSKVSIWLDLENNEPSMGLGYLSGNNFHRKPQLIDKEEVSGTGASLGSATRKTNVSAKKENVLAIGGITNTDYYKKYVRRASKMANPRAYLEGQIKLMQRDPNRFNDQITVIRQLLTAFE